MCWCLLSWWAAGVFLVFGLTAFLAEVFASLTCYRICIDKGTEVDVFISAWIAKWLFLLWAGIILSPILSGSDIPYCVSLLEVTESLSIGCPFIWLYRALKLLMKQLEMVPLSPFAHPEPDTGKLSNLIMNTLWYF